MSIMDTIIFMLFVLPVLIAIDGMQKLAKFLGEKNWLWVIPYVLLALLVIILVILLLLGYR